jgi:hypothetical protein
MFFILGPERFQLVGDDISRNYKEYVNPNEASRKSGGEEMSENYIDNCKSS